MAGGDGGVGWRRAVRRRRRRWRRRRNRRRATRRTARAPRQRRRRRPPRPRSPASPTGAVFAANCRSPSNDWRRFDSPTSRAPRRRAAPSARTGADASGASGASSGGVDWNHCSCVHLFDGSVLPHGDPRRCRRSSTTAALPASHPGPRPGMRGRAEQAAHAEQQRAAVGRQRRAAPSRRATLRDRRALSRKRTGSPHRLTARSSQQFSRSIRIRRDSHHTAG